MMHDLLFCHDTIAVAIELSKHGFYLLFSDMLTCCEKHQEWNQKESHSISFTTLY